MARESVNTRRDRDRRPARTEFLEDLQVHLVRLTAAAPLLRIRQPEQTRLTHLGEQAVGIPFGLLVLVDDRQEPFVGEIPGQRDEVVSLVSGQESIDGHGSSEVGVI